MDRAQSSETQRKVKKKRVAWDGMHPVASFLQEKGLRLNTDLGQHFLINEEILDAITETAKIDSGDHIVEIGPGIGVLTVKLLKYANQVTAIELDARLIPLLEEFVTENQKLKSRNLQIVQGNALRVDMPSQPYKIVANIPYHITSPLLRHVFLQSEQSPVSITLLIQREVAEKICLPFESVRNRGIWKDAGMLTILVGLFGKPSYVRTVPPDAFLPPPKVDSAVLHIECFEKPLADPETIDEVFRLVKIAFSQRRKMLRNSLGAFRDIAERLLSLGIEQSRRPQELSIAEWIAIAKMKI